MRLASFIITLTIAVMGSGSCRVLAAEPKAEAVLRWEYRVFTKQQILDLGNKDLAAGLNKLGDEGWELAGIDGQYIFKRFKGPSGVQTEELRRRFLLAESDVEMWKDRVAWCERMVKKGYMSERQAKADQTRLEVAELALEQARRELKAVSPEAVPQPEKSPKPEK